MLKKILFLGFTVSILIFSNNLFAEINSVMPLKKPILSKEENNQNPELFNYISATIIKNSI